MHSFILELRWLLWATGGLALALQIPPLRPTRERVLGTLTRAIEEHFGLALGALCGGFFLLALAGKFSQYFALRLNAQDFWLFEDMIRHMQEGAFFLTRFAPQQSGLVQHGAVHGMLTWALTLPLAWLTGPTTAALIQGPLMFALAAGFLGLLIRPRRGAPAAVAFSAAFLACTYVGKILMYDTHPEAAYPFFVFLWAWSLGLGDGKVRWLALALATLGGIGIKEDSFLVFFPLFAWSAAHLRKTGGRQFSAALFSGALGLLAYVGVSASMSAWASGAWGPREWQGWAVHVPQGPDLLQGHHWSIAEAGRVLSSLLEQAGGLGGALKNILKFLFSRPWLSLLALAPWTGLQARFWFLLLPLAVAYSFLQRATALNLYYSAPFLGAFWLCAALPAQSELRLPGALKPRSRWALLASLLLGSGSVQLFLPSSETTAIRQQAHAYGECLRGKHGIVQSQLLSEVPRQSVLSDRPPASAQEWQAVDFYLFTPGIGTYETPLERAQSLFDELQGDAEWAAVDADCKPALGELTGPVVLFVRPRT